MSQKIELPVIDDDDDDEELQEHESSQDRWRPRRIGRLCAEPVALEHVSDAIKIHKCACVISSSEREKYDLCLVNGKFVLFDTILYHSKNLPELGYYDSSNICATRI